MTSMAGSQLLQYAPLSSALDAGFWHQLSQLKLNVYGLDDQPRSITGFYTNGDADGLPSRINLDYNAFDEIPSTPPRSYPSHGILKNTNTLDDFKSCDKKHLMEGQAKKIWGSITSGDAIKDPSLLSNFLLLTFADLKKYHYYYWFSFPALCIPEKTELLCPCIPIEEKFKTEQIEGLLESFDSQCLAQHLGFFLVVEEESSLNVLPLTEFDSAHSQGKKGRVEVICLRDRFKDGKRNVSHSLVLQVNVPSERNRSECPKCVGWEKNERQKLGPRMVNLSSSMDPTKLAESAVDLNLKLMRWRLLPELDLETISATRCLLLGSGTLGCNVARCLLGWGIRNITLVDYGKISYSNPVRQSLFVFEDSLHGGQPKAQTAAEALRKIFPGVNTSGISLSVPMPGHTVTDNTKDQVKTDVLHLEHLIDNHDVVFLLMDTRESRWLPTVIGASKRKIVINAALGFDTYLIVRHGLKKAAEAMDVGGNPGVGVASSTLIDGSNLGCYFCNDVVAPGDSTRDRTLDQQCTVSRPGMSMMASALAVELLISVLTHPDRGYARADTSAKEEHLTKDFTSPLGLVPHQIRGFLSRFYSVMPASMAFDKCTACCQTVLESYEKEGFDFLMKAFNEPRYLEDLTGLTKLHEETNADDVWELTDDEDM